MQSILTMHDQHYY